VLGELGIPGLLCLMTLVFGNIRENTRLKRAILIRSGPTPSPSLDKPLTMLRLMSAAALGFAVPGAFLSAAYYPHVFVLAALSVSARRIARNEAEACLKGLDNQELPVVQRLRRPRARTSESKNVVLR
jgi:hypothetical protein